MSHLLALGALGSDHGHRVRPRRGDDGVVGRDRDGGAVLGHHGDGVADGLHVSLGDVHLQHTRHS